MQGPYPVARGRPGFGPPQRQAGLDLGGLRLPLYGRMAPVAVGYRAISTNPITAGMMYFFRRGEQNLTSETRLNPDGPGYQLVIRENDEVRVESFDALPMLLAREHELLQAWRAQGWTEAGQTSRTPPNTWRGPR